MRLLHVITGLALGIGIKVGISSFFSGHNSDLKQRQPTLASQSIDLKTALQEDPESPESLGFAFGQLLKQNQVDDQEPTPEREIQSLGRIPSSAELYPDLFAIAEVTDKPELLIQEVSKQLARLGPDEIPARLQLILEVHALSHEGYGDEALDLIFNEVNWVASHSLPNSEETLHHFSNLIKLTKSLGTPEDVEFVTNALLEESTLYSNRGSK